jgi:hypothetical protein
MVNFHKEKLCPTSQELLSFRDAKTAPRKFASMAKHLEACEFCTAELEFYSHYPQAENCDDPRQIPASLYELAEALLTNVQIPLPKLEELETEPDKLKTKSGKK